MKSTLIALLGVFTLIFSLNCDGQTPTVGLVHTTPGSVAGFTLFTPENNQNAYLIDECGKLVNMWTFSERPGLTAYLLENGSLLRAGRDSLEIRDWNNAVVWSYDLGANGLSQHHDIEPLPNGNVLIIMDDLRTNAIMLQNGKDTSFTASEFRLDKIIELEPVGNNQANVVWEWAFFDHLVQEFDPSLPNFGMVANHPELLDMNFSAHNLIDFTHVNSIDYNPALDQILITCRNTEELIIIDHSTSTAEAASHSGGIYGKGGDFLWRWGNPEIYRAGTSADKKLGLPHDARWILYGSHAGKISVFNNHYTPSPQQSAVHIISPDHTMGVYQMNGNVFSPSNYTWSWFGSILGTTFFEAKKSGVQVLPDDGVLICENTKGRMTQVSSSGSVSWSYVNPDGVQLLPQSSQPNMNQLYRGTWYQDSYQGLMGQNLSASATIENYNDLSDSCSRIVDVPEYASEHLSVFPNPANDIIQVSTKLSSKSGSNTVFLTDELGRILKSKNLDGARSVEFDVSEMAQGIYFIKNGAYSKKVLIY